jgi:hypothetical protein
VIVPARPAAVTRVSVLPTSWNSAWASKALLRYSLALDNPQVLGHLFTSWQRYEDPATYGPMTACMKLLGAGS